MLQKCGHPDRSGSFWSYVTAMPISSIYHKNGPNGLDWQCFLAGSSKTAPRILIFSIAMGGKYLSYVKSIATFALTFFGYVISVLASVMSTGQNFLKTYVCAVTAAAWRW